LQINILVAQQTKATIAQTLRETCANSRQFYCDMDNVLRIANSVHISSFQISFAKRASSFP